MPTKRSTFPPTVAQLLLCSPGVGVEFVRFHVLRARQGDKVLRAIVGRIAVDMMHVLAALKAASIGFLPHQTVFTHVAIFAGQVMTRYVQQYMPLRVVRFATFPLIAALRSPRKWSMTLHIRLAITGMNVARLATGMAFWDWLPATATTKTVRRYAPGRRNLIFANALVLPVTSLIPNRIVLVKWLGFNRLAAAACTELHCKAPYRNVDYIIP